MPKSSKSISYKPEKKNSKIVNQLIASIKNILIAYQAKTIYIANREKYPTDISYYLVNISNKPDNLQDYRDISGIIYYI